MRPSTFQEFVAFARTDAAIQERVAEALKGSQPVQDVIAVAAESGYTLAPDEVTAALDGAISDRDLGATVSTSRPRANVIAPLEFASPASM